VDELERGWQDGRVLRLEFTEPAVQIFGQQMGFETTPTFILYDGQGQEVQRWMGRPPSLDELSGAGGEGLPGRSLSFMGRVQDWAGEHGCLCPGAG
jgi:hypothetical protein